ncbi:MULTISPECIES: hypothetical protein [unclassified Streptomyces]|uniref:hypothetical protein n=1 Tax=unclassified Streptomyces TaxID=2593676 RepID=UPI001CBC27AD|nr:MULTISPECIES: hypothetical protein [unclassified Streptomyces]WPO74223.1 hypothetical protein R9806_28215 [Streptomyces sp. KN37]
MRSWMFGGVYGTVLASALLAALHSEGAPYTPTYDAAWVMVTAGAAAVTHGYAHHMATHRPGSAVHRWRQLARALLDEWPVVVACWPTVALLLLAGAFGWPEPAVTSTGLLLNAALLFGWGTSAALRVGYRRRSAVLLGGADAAIGLGIAVANAVIK